jgi:Flp pilus assembly protein TadG
VRNVAGRTKLSRGSTLVESAVVAVAFLLLMTGIIELGRLGFAYNEVSFAAQCAARYAAVRGGSSGHPASTADIQTAAKAYTAALDNRQVAVNTTWSPDNRPGGVVQVAVSYVFATALAPLAGRGLTIRTTARQIITQ